MARQPAQVYSGRYEILRTVARGGMAEVYLARDQLLDRPVALKVLFPELSVDRAFVERFRREAQAAANLSHPNIVSVYDWGEEDGTYFIVMEYVDGKPLSAIIRTQGALLADRAAAIGADVAAALAFAHRHGVVHRDVKPGNVLIDADGHVKVADFGIARAANSQENLTQTGAVMGTATYFSPEQAQGYGVDGRSDVYSLGVVLYEMVTGQPPFAGDNPVTIAYKHVRERPVPPRELNPAIPPAFEAIVLHAMAKDPADRYVSADELRTDLVRYRQGRRVVAPLMAPAPATRSADTTVVVEGDGTRAIPAAAPPVGAPQAAVEPPVQRRTGAYVALLFVMLAALAVLLFLLGRTLGIFGGETGTAQVVVPNVVGQPADDAERTLTERGLRVVRQLEDNEADPDVVFDQDPEGDTTVDNGTRVTLKISQGEKAVAVPSVVGRDEADARRALEALGFTVDTLTEPSEDQPAGKVLGQNPPGGSSAPKGATVELTVSGGKPKVTVPDVTGKDGAAALDDLVNAGLKVRTVQEASDTVEKGKVVRTDPAAGAQVDKGTTVAVYVSTGKGVSTVPNVIGRTQEEARAILESAGFKVAVDNTPTTNESDDGRVVDQRPDAGEQADKGSTVTITVGKKVPGF